jgi:quercetin dioxygenase-like cupin family protein
MAKYLNKKLFDKYEVMSMRMKVGDRFPIHYHKQEEHMIVIEGSYVDTVSGSVFKEGDIQIIPPFQAHCFTPLIDGYVLVLIKK